MAEVSIGLKVRDDGSVVIESFSEGAKSELREVGDEAKKQSSIMSRAFKVPGRAMKGLVGGITGAFRALTSLKSLILGTAAALGATKLAGSVLRASTSFEDYETRLTSLLGSQEEATRALTKFDEAAAKVPFTLDELVEGGVALQAFLTGTGLRSDDLAETMADLAAFMGTTVPEAASAWGRAMAGGAGAADIFRERGVLSLLKVRGGVDDLTKLSLPEFQDLMIDVFQDADTGISGSAERLSKTFTGIVSMVEDQIGRLFRIFVGPSGLDVLKKKLGDLLKVLQRPETAKFIERVGKGFFSWVKSIDLISDVIFPLLKGMTTGFFTIQRAVLIVRAGFEGLALAGSIVRAGFSGLLTIIALIGEGLVKSILMPAKAVASGLSFLADLAGLDGVAGALDSMKGVMESAENAAENLRKSAAVGLVNALKDADTMSRKLSGTMRDVKDSAVQQVIAIESLTKLQNALTEGTKKQEQALTDVIVKLGEVSAETLAVQLAFEEGRTFDFTPPETREGLIEWIALMERTREVLGTIPTEIAASRFNSLGIVIGSAKDNLKNFGNTMRTQGEITKEQAKAMVGAFAFIRSSALRENKAFFEIIKAADIAQAVADTFTAATAAFKAAPGPAGFALAAAVTAAGLANVAKIRAVQFGGGAGASSSIPSGGGGVAGGVPEPEPAAPGVAEVAAPGPTGPNVIINITGVVGNEEETARRVKELFDMALAGEES